MEIDTGASLSIMSAQEFLNLWPERSVVATDVTLHSYSGECIPVVGSVDVCVSYKGQKITLPLVIVRGVGPSLLGRNWLQNMQFNWQEIFWSSNATLEKVLEKYNSVFSDGLGTVKGFKARIHVDPQAPPKFSKARSVPYFYSKKVERDYSSTQNGHRP